MTIYVMRHGETEANRNHIICGWYDSPLTDEGLRLAALTGEGMKRENIRFDAAFSSPFVRAKQTCREVLEKSGNADVPCFLDERLCEVYAGDWDAKSEPGRGKETPVEPNHYAIYYRDPMLFGAFPGGEDFHDVLKRTADFLGWLVRQPYENVLVSTHGFAMMAMLNPLWETPADFWQGRGLPRNCSVNVIRTDGDGIRVIAADRIYYPQSD